MWASIQLKEFMAGCSISCFVQAKLLQKDSSLVDQFSLFSGLYLFRQTGRPSFRPWRYRSRTLSWPLCVLGWVAWSRLGWCQFRASSRTECSLGRHQPSWHSSRILLPSFWIRRRGSFGIPQESDQRERTSCFQACQWRPNETIMKTTIVVLDHNIRSV